MAGFNGGIPCMIMRGGTSKGAYFLRDDLPNDPDERDRTLLRIMGTPDRRQIDGIGGAHPLTSKVAVIGPAGDGGDGVEYLFLQLGVDEAFVSAGQNCGNILAGVGPFALERGLVEANGDRASVPIHMLNFDTRAVASFPVAEGRPVYAGTQAISGVPGSAAPVHLDFEGLAGSVTGDILPSGHLVDDIEGVECTLVDMGMPVVVIRAGSLGVTGYEDCAELESNDGLRTRLEAVRLAAGRLMNLGDVSGATVPKMTLVSPPRHGGSLSTRTFIPHRCHQAIGVLGAVSVATAVAIPGTVGAELLRRDPSGSVTLEHPTGSFQTVVELDVDDDGNVAVGRAGIVRTARKLMDGLVFPRPYD